jgi:hypothetical protein
MGYKSAWRLAIGKKAPAADKIDSLLTWMKYMAELADDNAGFKPFYEMIYNQEEERTENYISFYDEWNTCCHPFDLVIYSITDKAIELGLDWAYIRMGEDSYDIEERSNNGDIKMRAIISISDVEVE